jgi:crossover junction endodeoxyribonuclease RuvC
MIILGIDPGTRSTGFGVIDHSSHKTTLLDYGCIRPPATASAAKKYRIIFDAIEALIAKYRPEALSVEGQFMHKNALSAMKLGMARAMAILAAERAGIPIYEYAPKKAKKAIVGHGAASKEQVQRMMQALLHLEEPVTPDDAADALALALCHGHHIHLASCLPT